MSFAAMPATLLGDATQVVVIWIAFSPEAVQRLPSGPTTIARGSTISGTTKSTSTPGLVAEKRATPPACVAHSAPSGPVTMPLVALMSEPARSNSVTAPAGVIRATSLSLVDSLSATHMFPSGPCVRCTGLPVSLNSPSICGAAAASAGVSAAASSAQRVANSGRVAVMGVGAPRLVGRASGHILPDRAASLAGRRGDRLRAQPLDRLRDPLAHADARLPAEQRSRLLDGRPTAHDVDLERRQVLQLERGGVLTAHLPDDARGLGDRQLL